MPLIKCFGCHNELRINNKDCLVAPEDMLVICETCWKEDFKRESFLNYDMDKGKNNDVKNH